MIAQSSSVSERYALGSGIAEGLHARYFVDGSGSVKEVDMRYSNGFIKCRKTGHIQLRYIFMQDLFQQGIILFTQIAG